MKLIRTRNELLDYIVGIAPSRACERAMRTDDCEVLGGFKPPGSSLFVVVKVWTQNSNWLIALVFDEDNRRYLYRYPKTIEWEHWIGTIDEPRWSVTNGDSPTSYALQRLKAKRKIRRNDKPTNRQSD